MPVRPELPSGPRVPERAHGAVALLGLVALVAALFPGAWFQGGVFFQRDILGYWYPHIEVFVRAVGEGAWPLWNPRVTFGTPLLADPNLQIAYPLTWLNLVLLPATYFKLFVFVHCVGAGLGVWLLARRLGLPALSAFLAAGAWTASGPLLSSVSLFHHFASAAWVPWVLWALHRALSRGTLGDGLVLGAVAGGQLLAGSADVTFMTALAAAGVVLAFVPGGRGTGDECTGRGRLRTVARVLPAAVGFAVLLSAVQWWPTIAQVVGGLRLRLESRVSLYWSLHPASLIDLLVPGLVAGLPLEASLRQALFEGRGPLLASVYLGLPTVALVLLGILRGRRPLVWLLLVGFALFLVAALGRHTPVLPLLLELPLFGVFRYPQKYLLVAALPWALLAGVGLEAFARPDPAGRRRRVLAVGVVVLALAAALIVFSVAAPSAGLDRFLEAGAAASAAGREAARRLGTAAAVALATGVLFVLRWLLPGPRPALTVALLLLAVGDLAIAGRPVNALAPPELLQHRPVVLEAMQTGGASPRVHVLSYSLAWLRAQRERASSGGPAEWQAALGTIDRMRPPTGARWGVDGSYDGSFTGMASPSLSLLSVTAQRTRELPVLVRLLRLGSVDYVVALEDLHLTGLTEVGRFASVYAEPVRLFRVESPVPRSVVVSGIRAATGPGIVEALIDPAFDPEREVVLPVAGPSRPSVPDFKGTARLTRRLADRIELETTATAPGYLVITDSFDEGWRARVDGQPAEVLPANLLFCAVPVPAGSHRVELRYRPPAAAWGAGGTLLAIVVGLVAWESRRRRTVG